MARETGKILIFVKCCHKTVLPCSYQGVLLSVCTIRNVKPSGCEGRYLPCISSTSERKQLSQTVLIAISMSVSDFTNVSFTVCTLFNCPASHCGGLNITQPFCSFQCTNFDLPTKMWTFFFFFLCFLNPNVAADLTDATW